jgi:signal transduction histidine kinase
VKKHVVRLKKFYTFLYGGNAPCESLLTGFTAEKKAAHSYMVEEQKKKAFFYEKGREEPLSKVGWWILLRWVFLGVTILASLTSNFLLKLNFPLAYIFFLCLPVAFLNAFLHYQLFFLKKAPSLDFNLVDRITYVQFGTDLIFIAGIFNYTGGIASPLLFYFLFHVILSGVLLEQWACFLYVSLVALMILTLSFFEFIGFVPHVYSASFISKGLQGNPFFVLLLLFFFLVVLFISSSLVSTLLKHLRERISQLTELEEKLENTNQRLKIINRITIDAATTVGLSSLLEFICGSIRRLMGVKGVAIRMLDERTNQLALVSACGLSNTYMKKGPVDADKSLARALRGEPHIVLDVASDPSIQYPEEAKKEGIVSMVSFPLKGREKVIGTLRLYISERREFTQKEMDFVAALASQSAIFIENARYYDALKRQDEAKNDFIILMTHELKAPLAAIQGLLDVMLKGYVGTITDKQKELIERMQKRIDSVLEVSAELLDIYQWQAKGIIDKVWTLVSLKDQILKAEDLFQLIAQEKGLTLSYHVPEAQVNVKAGEDELEKVLNNLISNAIKYTPTGGDISVHLELADKQATLRVKDNGIGIAAEDIPKIFSEFFRTKEAKMIDPDGRGLGLPFVKKIVESLDGTIRVKSEKRQGTEFIVTLPAM